MAKLNQKQRAALKRIATRPYEAAYDNGVRVPVPRYVGATHKGISVAVVNTFARQGLVSKRQRLPRFTEGTRIVFVYEITALGRSALA